MGRNVKEFSKGTNTNYIQYGKGKIEHITYIVYLHISVLCGQVWPSICATPN